MKPAQVEPITASGFSYEMFIPVAVTAIIATAVVLIVFIAVRGTDSPDRGDALRGVADIVRELGDAIRKIIDAICRFFGGGADGAR